MTSGFAFQALLEIGFFVLVIFGPILFLVWYWSDKRLTTREWALLTCLMLIAGLFMRVVVIAVLAGLILIAIGVAWLWHRAILADVQYTRAFSRTHVFPGEESEVVWTLTNDKPLPISWLRWQEPIPVRPFSSLYEEGIQLETVKVQSILGGSTEGLDEVTALRGYETVVRGSKIHALRRGFYRFGPAHWQASDALGLYTAEQVVKDVSGLTVYPRISSSQPFQFQVKALLGDIRRRYSLVEDPVWYRGDRDYRTGDPMRMIDWKATARTANLQVKVFEPTVHPKVMLLVNLHAFEHISSGWVTEYMEDVISTAASLAAWAVEGGFEVGIHSNGALPDEHVPYRILPSSSDRQLFTILEYLAKIMLIVHRRIEDMLPDLDDMSHGTAVVICTNVVTQGLMNALTQERTRRDISLVLVDNEVEFSIPGVSVIHARAA